MSTLKALHHEVEAQVAGIDQLLQHQHGLHAKLLQELGQFGELQAVIAACAASLVGVPHPPIVTLHASLEVVARLGTGVLLSSGSEEWTAGELLFLFKRMQPRSLQMPVSLVTPGSTSDGAIYEVGARGEAITDAPLFYITRPTPRGPAPGEA